MMTFIKSIDVKTIKKTIMKKLKPLYILLVLISSQLLTHCSPSEDDSNNNPPGLFSANALGTGIDTGNVEWTESIDTDDDPVTYNVFLEGDLIAAGVILKTYNFSGLEPDTGYDGYIEAQDGRGGTSIAEFSFITEPEVIIFNVNASWWIWQQFPVSNGTGVQIYSGFRVPYYENAVSYQIEIIDYALFGYDDLGQIGRIYTWTNESQSTPVGPATIDQEQPGDFGVFLGGSGVTNPSTSYDTAISNHGATTGEAIVTVVISGE